MKELQYLFLVLFVGLVSISCNQATKDDSAYGAADIVLPKNLYDRVSKRYDFIYDYSCGLAKVKKDFLYGFINTKGKEVIPCQYSEAEDFSLDKATVMDQSGLWGIISNDGSTLVDFKYVIIDYFVNGLYKVCQYGLYGLIDSDGTIVVDTIYDDISFINTDLYTTKKGHLYGLISKDGRVIIEPKYTAIERLSSNLLKVGYYLHYGVIDLDGNVVLEPKCSGIDQFYGGFCKYHCSNGSRAFVGLMDETGKVVVAPDTYYTIGDFDQQGLAIVSSDGGKGMINKSGEVVIPTQYAQIGHFYDGLAFAQEYIHDYVVGDYGYIDINNNFIIEPKYSYAEDFNNGFAVVKYSNDKYSASRFGLIDKTGTFVIPPDFDRIGTVKNGYVRVCLNHDSYNMMWAIYDVNGKQITKKRYREVQDFSDGYAAVYGAMEGKNNLSWGYINDVGEEVIPCQYRWVTPFIDGVAGVSFDSAYGSDGQNVRYIDKHNKRINDVVYSSGKEFSEGLAAVKIDGKWGYINTKGDIEIEPEFMYANNFSEGYAVVNARHADNHLAYIDRTGSIVFSSYYCEALPFKNGEAYVHLFLANGWDKLDKNGNVIERVPNSKISDIKKRYNKL